MLGAAENAPPSILNSTLKPAIAATAGNANMAEQAFAGVDKTGAAGKTIAYSIPSWHAVIPLTALAGVGPHADVNLYLALMVQHPGVLVRNAFTEANVPYALKAPPGGWIAYSAVNEAMVGTATMLAIAALHVLAIAAILGAAGKMTKFCVTLHDPGGLYVAEKHPGVAPGVNI